MPESNTAASCTNVRELVMTYGWNTTAYQILNPGFAYWFAPSAPAVVAYRRCRNVLVVAGAPVCPREALAAVTAEFERFASAEGCRVCYVCAADRLRETMHGSSNHSTIVIGAQPVWNPREWPQIAAARRSIREQLARARNKGVTVETITGMSGRTAPELERILAEWLNKRALPPLHFLVEPFIADRAHPDRLTMVARREGAAVAFLIASPVTARNGFLIEQVARSRKAPNGSSELLIDAAMRRLADEGRDYATLGLVALSTRAAGSKAMNPWWLRLMMRLARAHANRFYNFRGLERFRMKMAPARWETIFAIANEPRFSMRTLYAIGEAFAGIPPWQAVGLGVMRAIGQESHRWRRRIAMAN
jgi:phosphatidylglycerol lysyltransferase